METSYLKAHLFGNHTLIGCPISAQTVAGIRIRTLRDLKTSKAQALPLYHCGPIFITIPPHPFQVKFIKAISTTCIPNFPDRNLPAIFVYFEGQMKKQFIGAAEFGKDKITLEGEPLVVVLVVLMLMETLSHKVLFCLISVVFSFEY